MEIQKQTQVFITVSHYFCMQIHRQRPYPLHDRNRANNVSQQNRKFDEELYDISYMGRNT